MNTQLTQSTIPQKLKTWWQQAGEPETVAPALEPIPEPMTVIDASSLATLEKSVTAVSGKLIQIDNLAGIHAHLFNIFYEIDARRMVMDNDPVLVKLELPRRWPNMECCIAGRETERFNRDPIDIYLHYISLPDKSSLSASVTILLAPISEIKQLNQLNGRSPQHLIIILYGD